MLRVGDTVRTRDNYACDGMENQVYMGIATVTAVKVPENTHGTTGQWIKTTHETEWVDKAWFVKVEERNGKQSVQAIKAIAALVGCTLGEAKEFYDLHHTYNNVVSYTRERVKK